MFSSGLKLGSTSGLLSKILYICFLYSVRLLLLIALNRRVLLETNVAPHSLPAQLYVLSLEEWIYCLDFIWIGV